MTDSTNTPQDYDEQYIKFCTSTAETVKELLPQDKELLSCVLLAGVHVDVEDLTKITRAPCFLGGDSAMLAATLLEILRHYIPHMTPNFIRDASQVLGRAADLQKNADVSPAVLH